MQIRVYYEDTDAGGIVYHSNYINFCERARSEHFFSRGLSPHLENGSFVVRHLECDYYAPAKLGEILHIDTKVQEIKNSSLILKQYISRDDTVLFEAKFVLVFINTKSKPSKIPQDLKDLFLEF